MVQEKDAAGASHEGGSDRRGDEWLDCILKVELIGLAGGLEQRVKEREEPRKAQGFWWSPGWMLVIVCRGDSEKSRWQMLKNVIRVAMGTSSSRVFPAGVQRAAGCLKPQQSPSGSRHMKSLWKRSVWRNTVGWPF